MAELILNLSEAKTALSRLVERAASGEEIVIAKNGEPRAKLVPLSRTRARRQPGGWEGGMVISEDFEDPLPETLLAAFGVGDNPVKASE
jgi:prevent-host-death family protein